MAAAFHHVHDWSHQRAVVFASGFSRWVGVAATPLLLMLWLRSG